MKREQIHDGPATSAALARLAGFDLETPMPTLSAMKTLGGTYYALRGEKTGIASGAENVQLNILNEGGATFTARRMRVIAKLNATTSSALKGTPLIREPSPTIGNNTLDSLATVRVQIKVGAGVWFSEPVSLLELMDANGEYWFDDMPQVPANQTITITLFNDGSQTIDVAFFFPGYLN